MIDQREWDAILRDLEEYQLHLHRPQLLQDLRSINRAAPSPLQQKLFEQVIRPTVEGFRAFHHDYPFVVAPPGTFNQGTVLLARQSANDQPLTAGNADLAHTGVIGRTGAGKSSFIGPIVEATLRTARVVDLALKQDRPWVALHPGTITIDAQTRIALLEREPGIPVEELARLIVQDYLEMFWGAAGQSGAILKPLEDLLRNTATPSLADWQERIRTGPKTEAARTAVDRFDAIRLEYPGLFFAREDSIPISTIHDSSLSLAPTALTPATRFVFWHLLRRRFTHLLRIGHRDALHTRVILDEGDKSLSKRQTTITGAPSVPIQLITQGREPGLHFLLCSTSWNELDPLVKANLSVKVILPLGDGQEVTDVGKALRLAPAATDFLAHRLGVGQALLNFAHWPHTILATYPPFTRSKSLTAAERSEIQQRNDHRIRKALAAREAMASHPAPSRSSAPSPPPTVAAVVEQAPPKRVTKSERRGALTAIEQRLVDYIASNGVVLTTECQHDLKLHPQQVARAKAKLLALTLVTSETIRCRAGRGGTGVALTLTPSGVALATTKPLRTTRGNDSVQHQFLATRIAKAIQNAQLELSLNGKSIDIVIPYNTSAHVQLIKSIGVSVALNDGDLLAIEVEVSNPAKTLASNVRKNTGIAHHIIAVLPNTLASAKRIVKALDAALRARVTVIDALELLDHLQESS